MKVTLVKLIKTTLVSILVIYGFVKLLVEAAHSLLQEEDSYKVLKQKWMLLEI